jgi:hypothetical protein
MSIYSLDHSRFFATVIELSSFGGERNLIYVLTHGKQPFVMADVSVQVMHSVR